jgi:hypothetical protein
MEPPRFLRTNESTPASPGSQYSAATLYHSPQLELTRIAWMIAVLEERRRVERKRACLKMKQALFQDPNGVS